MRTALLILCYLCSQASALGQAITSQVLDIKTGRPIPYVNIGIVGKSIGTVTDENGRFELTIHDALDNDTLRFSMVSYVSKSVVVSDIRSSGIAKSISMEERQIQLQEVVVSSESLAQIKLGLARKHCYPIPLYKGASSNLAFPQAGYRHEIGTRYSNDKLIYLDSIQLNFAAANQDHIDLRLNIYVIKDDVFSNILTEPIYISLSKEEAEDYPVIDLSKYQIELKSDFLISIENYKKLPGGSLKILANFKAKGRMYPTYYKSSTQGNWTRFTTKKSRDIGLSFIVFGQ